MRNLGIDVLEPETRVTGYGNKGNWIWIMEKTPRQTDAQMMPKAYSN